MSNTMSGPGSELHSELRGFKLTDLQIELLIEEYRKLFLDDPQTLGDILEVLE